MFEAVDNQFGFVTSLPSLEGDDPHWTPNELATFSSNPGCGRILAVRPGTHDRTPIETCLLDAGYCLGRLPVTRDPSHLPRAAATFAPDIIYVSLTQPTSMCLTALETLAGDPRSEAMPLVALLPPWATSRVIEEAYARSGCDFFRVGGTPIELLARTHLLTRLCRGTPQRPVATMTAIPQAANAPMAQRLDLRDLATGTYSDTYLRHRLPLEASRAYRYQRQLSILAVRCPSATDDGTAVRLAKALLGASRDVDLVARVEPDLFVVVLPETDAAGTGRLRDRIAPDLTTIDSAAHFGHATLGDAASGDAAYTGHDLLLAACRDADAPALPCRLS